MPITWDAEMDRKFFLAVLETSAVSVDNVAVAERLSTEKQPCTAMAVQKRLQKLKTMVKAGTAGDRDATPKAKGKTSPRKRQAEFAEDDSPSKSRKTKNVGAEQEDGLDGLGEDVEDTINVKREASE